MRQLFTQLSKESVIYGLSAAGAKLVGFFLVPLYTRVLSQSDYGVLNLIVTLTGILSALLILGLDGALLLRFYGTASEGARRQLTSTFLLFELALSVVVCAALFVLSQPLAVLLLGGAEFTPYVQLGVAVVPFSVLVTIFLQVARLVRLPWRYLAISLGNLLLTATLVALALLALDLGLTGLLLGTLVGSVVFCLVGWWYTRLYYSFSFSWDALRELLRLSWPLLAAGVSYWVINFSNLWFLYHLASANDVAVMALAGKLLAPVVLLVTAFQVAWAPFSLSIAHHESAELVYARTLLYFLAGTYGVLLLLTLFAAPLIAIFATTTYLPAMGILALVGMASVAYGVYYIVATGVNLAEKTIHIGWTTGAGAVVSVVGNLLLIPMLGIVGAGLAGVAANLVLVALLYRESQRLKPIPYDLPRAWLLTVVASLCLAGATLLHLPTPALDFAMRGAIMLVFIAALAPLGVVRGSDLRLLRTMLRDRVGRGAGA